MQLINFYTFKNFYFNKAQEEHEFKLNLLVR